MTEFAIWWEERETDSSFVGWAALVLAAAANGYVGTGVLEAIATLPTEREVPPAAPQTPSLDRLPSRLTPSSNMANPEILVRRPSLGGLQILKKS